MAFSAFLDACVLVPSRGRDVLLEVAVSGVYRPLWGSGVLDELARTLRKLRERREAAEDATDAYVGRLIQQMTQSFPDALVEGWERIEDSIELPDPDDRHVVAAAVIGRADVIVTDNTKDFPRIGCRRRCSPRSSTSSCSTHLTCIPPLSSRPSALSLSARDALGHG